MELWRWDCETNRVLILNTRGKLPDVQERGLLLCRSLTLPAERLLLGPIAWEPCPRFLRIDWEGVRIPANCGDAAVWLAFLAAAGYGVYSAASDGIRTFFPSAEEIAHWRGTKIPEGEIKRLLSLN